MTVTEFILARIADDEATARAASPGPWHADSEEVLAVDGITVCDAFALSGPQTRATAAHIATQDPARVLAQCAAVRAIVSLCAPTLAEEMRSDIGEWDEVRWRGDEILCRLAAPYFDHPDFDPAWRR